MRVESHLLPRQVRQGSLGPRPLLGPLATRQPHPTSSTALPPPPNRARSQRATRRGPRRSTSAPPGSSTNVGDEIRHPRASTGSATVMSVPSIWSSAAAAAQTPRRAHAERATASETASCAGMLSKRWKLITAKQRREGRASSQDRCQTNDDTDRGHRRLSRCPDARSWGQTDSH